MPEIHLSEQDEKFIEEQVAAGIFKDADSVVSAGLRLLGSNEGKLVELQRLIEEGLDDVEAGRMMEFSTAEDLTAHIIKLAGEQNEAKASSGHRTGAGRSSHRS
ncbi:type II toxin-antitoxin system ParD family antitoxin [Agrobacterium salinitolerans]|uniref:type II toxin-antitoxin system ParD family antitoxin n=1 Tax=Agrobacterium salinitolerans TaxID=1183413 RepID=UPI0022B8247D|nr:type II toxin-antitoxin system ParD family antitoxin [Agrobacterium salinitolerans]MCZ7855726.1 type II toxin-antitoxin system ParD family antitoxin [Agrobacterium salinitolerans]